MTKTLSYAEKQLLEKQINDKESIIEGQKFGKARILEVSIPENEAIDKINKKMYEYYHSLISNYESEKSGFTGENLANPLKESDFTDRVNLKGRLYLMTNPDIVRIPEFDSLGDMSTVSKEGDYFPEFSRLLNRLTLGLNTSTNYNYTFSTSITSSSTSIQVGSGGGVLKGKEFIARNGDKSFVGECTEFRTVVTGTAPNTITSYYIDFKFITKLEGVMSGGDLKGEWNGFSDVERRDKISDYGMVMQSWLLEFDPYLSGLSNVLNREKLALEKNLDEELDERALTEVLAMVEFLNEFQAEKDISDAGVLRFRNKISSRKQWIGEREVAIDLRKASFFNKRFNWAILRAGRNGSMMAEDALQRALANADNIISNLEAEIAIMKDV